MTVDSPNVSTFPAVALNTMSQDPQKLTKDQRDAIAAKIKEGITPAHPPKLGVAEKIRAWRVQFRAYRNKGFNWEQLVEVAAHPKINIKTKASSLARIVCSKAGKLSLQNQLSRKERDGILAEATKGMKPARPPGSVIERDLREWDEQLHQWKAEGYGDEQIAGFVNKPDIGIPAKPSHIRNVLAPAKKKKVMQGGQ